MSQLSRRVAALYWDTTNKTSGAEEKDETEQEREGQSELASVARRIATDYTLAVSIGKALRDKLFSGGGALYPANTFVLKDTYANSVKGFGGGYFSFGLEPQVWVRPPDPQRQKVLGSGSTLLVWGAYDPTGAIRSTRPADPQAPWAGNPQMAGQSITANIAVGYYNKLSGGGVKREFPVGRVLIQFNEQEEASVEILDPAQFKAALDKAIADIQADPNTPGATPPAPKKPVQTPVAVPPSAGRPESWDEYQSVDNFYHFMDDFGIEERGDYVFGPVDVNRLLYNLQKSDPSASRRDIIRELEAHGLTFNQSLKISSRRRSIASRVAARWLSFTTA